MIRKDQSVISKYSAEAETAVVTAIENLVAAGDRAYAHNVPSEAENMLVAQARGRLNRDEANKEILRRDRSPP